MTDFRTLPVEEAIAWIRAWTDHTWPMSIQEAFTIRDNLGWKPFPNEPDFFTTPLSRNGHWGGYILQSKDVGIKGVSFDLSSPPSMSPEMDESGMQSAEEALFLYASPLKQLWGPGKVRTSTQKTTHLRWTLPNKVSTSLIRANVLINVTIDSPWRTQIKEDYDRAMEDCE
ncbi:hypothetical protein J5X07_08145 [Actinomyces bowdenii]|uniref:DUF6301 family protein n=1 Tax=Actinomyces bowdenii TaxID=131109 RepID=UPI001ABCA877|nr:DUF6301 family protein [Actinomyces bowdenii]MBO3724996.1 hypothetical protein [Actinomyces bowdenii]